MQIPVVLPIQPLLPHQLTPEMRLRYVKRVEYRDDIADTALQSVGSGTMRLSACPVCARIDQDQLEIRAQPIDVAAFVPVRGALRKTMLEDQRRTLAFELIVNCYAVIVGIGHRASPQNEFSAIRMPGISNRSNIRDSPTMLVLAGAVYGEGRERPLQIAVLE